MAVLNALIAGTRLLPGAAELLAEQAAALPQKNGLCGPFCALLALRAAGVAGSADQDQVALIAGSVLPAAPGQIPYPPGETGRDDFRLALPRSADPDVAGTSAPGLMRAIERISGGSLAVVPARGEWTARRLRLLLDAVAGLPRVAVLANIVTSPLWDHATPSSELARYLKEGDHRSGRNSSWQVGHFVVLAGVLDGPAGTLVLILDGYPSLGAAGLHLQPMQCLAAGLRRDGMPPGGLLLVVDASQRHQMHRLVLDQGLQAQPWDNGSADAAVEIPRSSPALDPNCPAGRLRAHPPSR